MKKRNVKNTGIVLSFLLPASAFLIIQLSGAWRVTATTSNQPTNEGPVASRIIAEHPPVELVERRDDHTRIWEIAREVETTHPDGSTTVDTVKSYIHEKASGLCYKDGSGNYVPSVAEWRETPEGFVIDRCPYRLAMGKTIGTPARYTVEGQDLLLRPAYLVISHRVDQSDPETLTAGTPGSIMPGSPSALHRSPATALPFPARSTVSLCCVDSMCFRGRKHAKTKEGHKMRETIQPGSPVYSTDLGFIRGRVTTDKGLPLTGCFVVFYDLAKKRFHGEDNLVRLIRHTADGSYVSPPLKPGRYAVLARFYPSHESAERIWIGWAPNVPVQGGKTATADVTVVFFAERWPGAIEATIGPDPTQGKPDPEVAFKPAFKVVPVADHEFFGIFLKFASVYERLLRPSDRLLRPSDPEEW